MRKVVGSRAVASLPGSRIVLIASASLVMIACDKVNEGMVVGSTPDPSCTGCYFSEVDNPEITRWDNLQPIDNDAEYAVRAGNTWTYNNFDLQFKAWGGDPGKGAVTNYNLLPQPMSNGTWDATQGEVRMPWRVRGIELGYSLFSATATHYDLQHSSTDIPALPVRAQLHPDTILVPIQVVRVMPPRTSPYYEEMQLETHDIWKNFFDYAPLSKRAYRISHPGGKVNVRVDYQETPIREHFTRPDEIFKQCGIQFRMIDCDGSARGCPDLHVQDDRYVAPEQCGHGFANYPEVRSNWDKAAQLPNVDPHLPIVLLMVRASGWCLQGGSYYIPMDVARQGRASFSTRSRFESPYTPAHELGHVLGLPDINCRHPTKGLMCELGLESQKLTENQCSKAREIAAGYARRKWGVNIAP